MSSDAELVVLGLGNSLCGDDGLGVECVARIDKSWEPPPGAALLDGGTLGLQLLGWIADVPALILVDAVRADAPPGSLVRLAGDAVAPAVRERLSPHQIGVADLLDSLRLLGRLPRHLVLIGLVPESLALGDERTEVVRAALPTLVDAVLAEAASLGYAFEAREPRGEVEHAPVPLW